LERRIVGLAQCWCHPEQKKHSGEQHLVIRAWARRCVVGIRGVEMGLFDTTY
jgi:hypothetical protein